MNCDTEVFKHIKGIYISLILMLVINAFLSPFIKNTTILRFLELVCLCNASINLWKLKRKQQLNFFCGGIKLLVFLFLFVCLEVVCRGDWSGTPISICLHILHRCMPYLVPFILLFLPNRTYQEKIIRIFFYASLLYIPLVILNFNSGLVLVNTNHSWAGESIGQYMAFFSTFLLGFMKDNFSKKEKCLIVIVWGVYFFLMILNARRNVCFSLAVYAVVAYYYIYFFKNDSYSKLSAIIVSVIFVILIYFNFQSLIQGSFHALYDRVGEDTRSSVNEFMLADFASSPIEEWIFGRGVDGGYYQEFYNYATGEMEDIRYVIETGYLNVMLKGGILMNVIVILIIFVAIKQAYKTNVKDSYYMGTILITYLIDNYTTNTVLLFNSRTIILWFIISCLLDRHCLSKKKTPEVN